MLTPRVVSGIYNCIGKSLALLNIRTTLARLIMSFDITLGSEDNMQDFRSNDRVHFTLSLGDLWLKFTKID